ncbi:MAG: YifB family Mg chelatase-like AAA ATPase [Spirochaetia bacterium]|jgi:magnesium chelatase family protein|nr:YifB family Mg chelatase-like AAA ATPase [Spirochaetia bacterium]
MNIISYCPGGFEGDIVSVEADLRTGIPGVDLVGMPDTAVRESIERVRIAIKNSSFDFPGKRIVVNLAPAGIKKEGASFDLPIAVSILQKTGLFGDKSPRSVMVLGELQLSGVIRPVNGVLSAVIAGEREETFAYIVPEGNIEEASSSRAERIYPCRSLSDAVELLKNLTENKIPLMAEIPSSPAAGEPIQQKNSAACSDPLSEIRGHEYLKKALCVAAAGMHNLLLFGPPGSGKTLAGSRLVSLLPDLSLEDSIEVTRIYSLAGLLKQGTGLIKRPPCRSPHHTSSMEGLIGGGRILKPGEISLAHKGVLFLDETPEFRKSILQCLREPAESGRVDLARAGKNCWFPADFQLILAANPCPCGNRGKDDSVCLCSDIDIYRYWKRVGGALLDRIDIRIPVMPVDADIISGSKPESSIDYRKMVRSAAEIQAERYKGKPFRSNSRIPAGECVNYIQLQERSRDILSKAVKKFSFSSRAVHSVMKIARTCADIKGNISPVIDHESLLEAIQFRRYGDRDFFW